MLVVAIHVAPGSRLPVRALQAVEAEAGKGLAGDRYHGTRHRHVTIQSQEMLDLAAGELGYRFDPSATRRNLTVDAGGDIPTTPGARLAVGEVELEVVRVSAPCRLLDDFVGPGAAAALRRRAGSTCRLLTSGTIHVGDIVELSEAAIQVRRAAGPPGQLAARGTGNGTRGYEPDVSHR